MECVGKGTPFATERGIPNGMPICNNVKLKHYIYYGITLISHRGAQRNAKNNLFLCVSL